MKSIKDYLKENEIAARERQAVYSDAFKPQSCTNKAKFCLKDAIKKAKNYGMFYYKCGFCGQYHLTKQPTYDFIMNGGK